MTANDGTLAPGHDALAGLRRRGDRLMSWLLLAHGCLAAYMASEYATWSVTATIAPLTLAMFFGARLLAPGTFLVRATAGIALQSFCALHIYQYHGLSEQHFWFFTSTTAMIVYQDPKALWPGVALIIAQHILFAALHNSGVRLYFFEETHVGVTKLSYHFGIALVQTALAATIATGLRDRTVQEAALRADLVAARERTERAAMARSSFLASMSHEFRTPMNGIEGMADVLLQDDLEADQRDCVETIRASSRALLAIVGDILDFSKIESGKLMLVSQVFSPERLVRSIERILATRAESNGVTLTVEIDPGLPSALDADEGRLRQILLNLVGNALKFAPNGHVKLTAGGELERPGRFGLILTVEDDGIGIAPEVHERIFEPFEQADSKIAMNYGGTGLGLAITRRLVNVMGGRLTLRSALGVGSTFAAHVSLAVADEPPPLPRAARLTPDSSRIAGTRVLLVEDNVVNQKVARRLLVVLGCEVTVAADGVEALERLDAEGFDLVLMDCQMPRMDGYEATRRRRATELHRGLSPTPIVALTAGALEEDHERCRRDGMDECLTKPVTLEALAAAVARHLPHTESSST